jgi:hypothetical protein
MDAHRLLHAKVRDTLGELVRLAGGDPNLDSLATGAYRIEKVVEARGELAALLWLTMYDAHPDPTLDPDPAALACLVDTPFGRALYARIFTALTVAAAGDGGSLGARVEQIRTEIRSEIDG